MRNRNWCLLLYPDCSNHVAAFEKLLNSYECTAILHDKDVDDNGDTKKAHWHVVLVLNNARTDDSLSKELGIEKNYINPAKNLKAALLYLLHEDNTDKYHYSIEEVKGNKDRLTKILNGRKDEGDVMLSIIDYIEKYEGLISYSSLIRHCCNSDEYATLRRCQTLISKCVEEHNAKYVKH